MESSISDQFSQLSETVLLSCRDLLKPPKRKNAYWFEDNDTHLDRLLETRRAKFKKYLHQRTPENKKIHQQSQRTVREHLRTMENKFWEKQSSELEQYSMRGNSHAFYKCLKTIYGPNKSQSVQQIFQKKDGTLTKSPQESLARLQEYYSELLNRNILINPIVDTYIEKIRKPTQWELDQQPTQDEFYKAIKSAKNRKSGTDVISIELLKYTESKFLTSAVFKLITRIWETLEIPESFLELILCSIYKKGDRSQCKNQRGISLISYVSKILTLLLKTRLYAYCERISLLPESQIGFRKGRNTVDMIFTAKLLQQSCREKQLPLFFAFLDIAKAYDSVDRQTLWKILKAIGTPPTMLAILKLLYGETKYRVKLNGKFSEAFLVKQGLKQGCPAACLLFNIFFAVIIHIIHEKLDQKGVVMRFRINGDIFDLKKLKAVSKTQKIIITELLFAVDAAICSHFRRAPANDTDLLRNL